MDIKPRKIPTQERARATVEAIYEATTQLLQRDGYAQLTTARVAERAGVSIGSFYQYFPNKQALAAAVHNHYGEKFLEGFRLSLETAAAKSLDECVAALVHAALVDHPHPPDLHRILLELTREVARADKSGEFAASAKNLIADVLTAHRSEIAPDLDIAEAAAMIETILEAVVHRAVSDHPVKLDLDRVAAHCRRMIMAYLVVPDVISRKPALA